MRAESVESIQGASEAEITMLERNFFRFSKTTAERTHTIQDGTGMSVRS